MTLALLFPGQGTQHPAMLDWVDDCPDAADTLSRMADRVGQDWRARLQDADWATRNSVAQSLLTGLSIAAWQCVSRQVPEPAVVAGYSVGELPAFCAAGIFDRDIALALARDRAELMERSVAGQDTGLLAVAGLGGEAIASACTRFGLSVAIMLAADRVVLGGLLAALDQAEAQVTRSGGRCNRLAVRLASHTPWMASAVPPFATRIAALPFAVPRAAVVCNLTGAVTRHVDDLKAALSGQLASPVRWQQCMETIAERQPRCVLEVGPGSTLSRLWRDTHPEIPARSIDEFRSREAVARWVNNALAA